MGMMKLFAIMTILATLALSGSATDHLRGVRLQVANKSGCGGYCVQVVIMRNGKEDCRSSPMPYATCSKKNYGDGFSAGDLMRSDFGSNCSPVDEHGITFQLHTWVGGTASDWCVSQVTFTTDRNKTYRSYWGYYEVTQGDWKHIHYAARVR